MNTDLQSSDRARSLRGLSLIEVLIALLVLSIGLVGVAALHLNSLQNTQSSLYSSLASTIALDVEEHLWLEMGHRDYMEKGCLSTNGLSPSIEAATAKVKSKWDEPSSSLTMPGLEINAQLVDSDDTFWQEIAITVEWEDQRFNEQNEVFNYTARIICGIPDDSTEE